MLNTLIGGLLVVVGSLVALGGNYWLETKRWKREDQTRFRSELYHQCVEFYMASHDWRLETALEAERSDDARALNDRFLTALAHIALSGPLPLRKAADKLAQAATKVNPEHKYKFTKEWREAEYARERFAEVARTELRIELPVPEDYEG